MVKDIVISVFAACVFLVCYASSSETVNLLRFLRLPDHDGVSRVCRLEKENFTEVVSDIQFTTVLFAEDNRDQKQTVCRSSLDVTAEILSQLLLDNRVRFCKASVTTAQASQEVIDAGTVLVYKAGRKIPYHGLKTTSALLTFLMKLNSTQVKVISGRLEKVAFDTVQDPKVVGFFMKGTADYAAFEEASSVLSPAVHFYAVFDRTVAKHLKLDVVGQVQLYRPMQKLPLSCPVNPASAGDLETFISEHFGAVFTKLTLQNINEPKLADPTRSLVVVIGEQTSPLGAYLYKLLTKIVKNNTNCTDFQKLNILWIEPDLFPAIYLSLKAESSNFPNELPCLGHLHPNSTTWFDLVQLNTTANKTADEQNIAVLQLWFQSVLNNTVASLSKSVQSFKEQPQSQTLIEGSDFVLSCVVANPVGDCLWLHNGQNLGFNMARYNGQYNWAGTALSGDCSLKVVGGQAGKQDGDWVCEMTGNSDNPTITSVPAKIVITKSSKKSEL